jgi:Family of unknown function (DUF5682)
MFLHFCAKFMQVHLLGIRHHGVGSARQVSACLTELRPDLILVEGPPDFDALLSWVAPDKGLVPPVALLGYDLANPRLASFYPFSVFSPEWQAIQYANAHRIPVRMMDLPLGYAFELALPPPTAASDPMLHLARLEGYTDSETWWEYRFESGSNDDAPAHFEAVLLAMSALREAGLVSVLDAENRYREAWMRQIIRDAAREMYSCVAVVCGAWHTPALLHAAQFEKADRLIIKELSKPKLKIATTWVPWTNGRLALKSGYGAGVSAPGWSAHRWHHFTAPSAGWLTKAARLFRDNGREVATAQVIEAERLAVHLAALRDLHTPGLSELQEAMVATFCMGDATPLALIQEQLVVGALIGMVPAGLPQVPLQTDFEQEVKRLKIKLNEAPQELVLDLRNTKNTVDLDRSILFHRLLLLTVQWAQKVDSGRTKGSFKETWLLEWQPEVMVTLIERGAWGNTLAEATATWTLHRIERAATLSELTQWVDGVLATALPNVLNTLIERIRSASALCTDVIDLMTAIQPFAQVIRYGDVRKSDQLLVGELLSGIMERVCLGLPAATQLVDDELAQQLFTWLHRTHTAVTLLQDAHITALWNWTLQQISTDNHANPMLNGCALRLLFDARLLSHSAMTDQFSLALSTGQTPEYTAVWVEGFLKGSSANLLYDNKLWEILYQWVMQLSTENFDMQLPLLRRTFATFAAADRRRLGEKVQIGTTTGSTDLVVESATVPTLAMANLAAMTQLMTYHDAG